MENASFRKFYLFTLIGVAATSAYPIYMTVNVIISMIKHGTVFAQDYPKYIIPYAPICLAITVGAVLIPILCRRIKKHAFLAGSAVSVAVFFLFERILETTVTVTRTFTESVLSTELEAWQMSLCYVDPSLYTERTWTEVDVLMGEYSPAFKIHFYIISVLIILAVLNCLYGFAAQFLSGDKSRQRALILQSASAATFIGMCIWACFTAFYRDGAVYVSAASAVLMTLFFVLMGVTAGIFAASFLHSRKKRISAVIPALTASAVTLMMYLGEMILLSGHLYRFGHGLFFDGLPCIVLAPIDIATVALSGIITALAALWLGKPQHGAEPSKSS